MLGDNRIHVTSSQKISIIAYVSDTESAVDYFLGYYSSVLKFDDFAIS